MSMFDDFTTEDLDRAEHRYWDDYSDRENADEEEFLSRERALRNACEGEPFYMETDGYMFELYWRENDDLILRTANADMVTDVVDKFAGYDDVTEMKMIKHVVFETDILNEMI